VLILKMQRYDKNATLQKKVKSASQKPMTDASHNVRIDALRRPYQRPTNRLGTPFCPTIKPLSPSNQGEELLRLAVAAFPLWEHGWLVIDL
jgi:hypothetical protein